MTKPGELTWAAVARSLNTTVKSLRNWRAQFPDAPTGRNVAAWRQFMRSRGLSYCSGRRNAPLPPADDPEPHAAVRNEIPNLSRCSWDQRRSVVFELLEFVCAAHRHGELTTAKFVSTGDKLMPLLCRVADALAVPADELDRAGWKASWREQRRKAEREP